MSDSVRHTRFLVKRLTDIGLEVKHGEGESFASGELPLGSTPFQTLGKPLVVPGAAFYTLGHTKLKFYRPDVFFDLPGVEVARCQSTADVETALRRAWSARMKDLRAAQAWLESLGSEPRVAAHGCRLLLPVSSERAPPVYVRSTSDLHLPSGGPLATVSLGEPRERHHRPLRSLEHSSELELGVSGEMVRLARKNVRRSEERIASATLAAADDHSVRAPRILVLDDEATSLALLESGLSPRFAVDAFQDPARALSAFKQHSYEMVLADARMRRVDGLEFTARLQTLAGIEKLPVVLFDDRANSATERAAHAAGASGYILKPGSWSDAGELLTDILDATNWRRFIRYFHRLPVEVSTGRRLETELTQTVARGGISVCTRRELTPGRVDRYRITLPEPLPPLEADAAAVMCMTQPGAATQIAGLRFVHFVGDGEAHWIRLIEAIARRAANRQRPPER